MTTASREGVSLARLNGRAAPDHIQSAPRLAPSAGWRYWLAVGALGAILVSVAVHNAIAYPIYGGYDEAQHQAYANSLVRHGRFPSAKENSEYTQAPGFYAVAGSVAVVADHLGAGDPWKVARALNIVWLVVTAGSVLLLARLLWPERPVLQLGALAFFVFVPVVLKTAAMFHPEPLSMALVAAAVYLGARLLVRRDWRPWPWFGVGLILGAGQLVRAFALWGLGAILLTLLAASPVARRRAAVAAAAVAAGAALVAGPWYVRQEVRYGTPLPFNRPTPSAFLLSRRPIAFYTALGLPDVFTHPVRPYFVNDALPTVYSELWGDYLGNFAWAGTAPSSKTERQLKLQNEIGLLPTALALAGWVALLVCAARTREPATALLPLFGLVGVLSFLYFTVANPSPDGDVLKATYLLTTIPVWAVSFGWALDRVARDRWIRGALLLMLAGTVIFDLGFVIFQSPLEGAF
jgi:hypothetical protein